MASRIRSGLGVEMVNTLVRGASPGATVVGMAAQTTKLAISGGAPLATKSRKASSAISVGRSAIALTPATPKQKRRPPGLEGHFAPTRLQVAALTSLLGRLKCATLHQPDTLSHLSTSHQKIIFARHSAITTASGELCPDS